LSNATVDFIRVLKECRPTWGDSRHVAIWVVVYNLLWEDFISWSKCGFESTDALLLDTDVVFRRCHISIDTSYADVLIVPLCLILFCHESKILSTVDIDVASCVRIFATCLHDGALCDWADGLQGVCE